MAHTDYKIDKDNLKLTIQGRLDADTVSQIWSEALSKWQTLGGTFIYLANFSFFGQ